MTILQIDPHLQLIDDIRLQAVLIESEKDNVVSGSQEDEVSILKSLGEIDSDEQQLKETATSHFMTKYANLPEVIPNSLPQSIFFILKSCGYVIVSKFSKEKV